MNKGNLNTVRLLIIGLLYLGISICFMHSSNAKTEAPAISTTVLEAPHMVLNSHSFNAKKRSNFDIAGLREHVERGLTIIHFNSSEKYEFRTYDTYASEEASQKVIDILWRMQKNKAVFAILAHDSAASGFLKQSEELKKMGFAKLSTLQNRQAYVMHNFNKVI